MVRLIVAGVQRQFLKWIWLNAHHLRRLIRPRRETAVARRVVHAVTSFDIGGTQTQVMHLCTATQAAFDHRATEVFPELNYLFRVGVRLSPEDYGVRGPLGRLIGRFVTRRNSRGHQLVQIYKLARDFARERPTYVVGWGHEVCLTTFVAATLARVPHIVFCIRTVNPSYGWIGPWWAKIFQASHRRMHPYVTRVIVNSTFLQRDHAAWLGIHTSSIAVCANGVCVPFHRGTAKVRSELRQRYGIGEKAVVVCNVGRFSPEKGQATLVEANRLLIAHGSGLNIFWLLCGDGPTQRDIEETAVRQGMANVKFVGRTRNVGGILAASDVFVIPSAYEGMPTAMMEAMAVGLACISTRASGATDLARDGIEALFFDAGDAQHLADLIAGLAGSPDRARAIGDAAKFRMFQFSIPRFVACFDDILRGVGNSEQVTI